MAPQAPRGPLVSVVVPVYNVAAYLPECLDSVLSQTLRDLEVILVDDGSTDASPEIIARYVAADPRVSAYRQENAGQGAARNVAVEHSRGRYLTFLDADDTLPEDAYRTMVRTLEKSGSDFCLGSVRRVSHGRLRPAPWSAAIHAHDRIGTTIHEFPVAMQDVIACNRMFRREFWVERVGGFRAGIAYEDHVPMVVAYLRADRFDVLKAVTYWWRIREDQTSTGQQKHVLQNLLDRIEVKAEAEALVAAEGTPRVYDAWVGRVLNTDLPPFVPRALAADDTYRAALSAAYRRYLDAATPEALQHVRVQQKLQAWLISRGLWDQVELLRDHLQQHGDPPRTRLADGRVYADLAVRAELDPAIDEELFELAELETALLTCLQHVRWVEDGVLELVGWTYVRGVDLAARRQTVTLELVETTSGRTVELPVEPLVLPEATRWSGSRQTQYAGSGFRTVVHVERLADHGEEGKSLWALGSSVNVDGVERRGSADHVSRGGSAESFALQARPLPGTDAQLVPVLTATHGFCLRRRPRGVAALELGSGTGPRVATGRLDRGTSPLQGPAQLRVTQRQSGAVVTAPVDEATGAFAVELPADPAQGGSVEPPDWKVELVDGRRARQVEWVAGAPDRLGRPGPGRAAWSRAPSGYARLVADVPLLVAEQVDVQDESVRVVLQLDGLAPDDVTAVTWSGPVVTVSASHLEAAPGSRLVVDLPVRASQLGGPALPLPPGAYALHVVDAAGAAHPVRLAAELLGALPTEHLTPHHHVRVEAARPGRLRLVLGPPHTADERGAYAQQQLRAAYARSTPEPEHSVLFQCYLGEVATDSQRALHEGLVRRGSGLTLYWGVRSTSTQVPEGGVPLLIGSREWYDTLARSTYLSNNIDFEGFFRKRPFQRYLQTFHGYPFKSMGRGFWAGKGFSEARIDAELARRRAEWDAIVVPSELCVDLYRREYDYDGRVLVTGYPRCDALVEPAPGRREQVLRRLGVDPAKTVVLYAPTYRDDLTTVTYAAKRFDGLDLDRLARALGEDYFILLRGHNNNQRDPDRVRGVAQVLDVTDHPEINDLTVAADVAVLDYSSLRFDWAITRKPVLFFVPDLEEYFARRPPLFPFTDSAPGPLLRTTDEVAEALKAVEDLGARYEPELRAFNETYNALHDGRATDRVLDAFFPDAVT